MKFWSVLILLGISLSLATPAYSWDAVGHRLSAAVALSYLSPDKQQALQEILQQHPRYQADFLDSMPASVQRGDLASQQQWLLGQAAYWPDIARGLPPSEAALYNRPDWHYLDGAWVRDAATDQGNMYIGIRPYPDIQGAPAESVRTESDVSNIMTALDYNTRVLADTSRSGAERAIALCWVLHLMGDIHQPLHTGSLYSDTLFDDGDRGGNRIATDDGNLHARWDRALAGSGVTANLRSILGEQERVSRPRIAGMTTNWSQWLAESRGLLLHLVYSDSMKAAIAAAERTGAEVPVQRLDARYVSSMERLARQRIGLAGLRIAIWVENSL